MTKEEIDKICKEYNIQKYTINSDGSIDVDGDVNLSKQSFTQLPLKFNKVTGDFDCSNSPNLTSLEGSPNKVSGDFYCTYCLNLTSLEGSPNKVGGSFNCYECPKLTSLQGSPNKVGENFLCYRCPNLESLEGSPNTVGGVFNCYRCPNLKNPYNFRYALYTGTSEFACDDDKINNIINKYKGNSSTYHMAIEELLTLAEQLGFSND